MAKRHPDFLNSRTLILPAVVLLAVTGAAGLYMVATSHASETASAAQPIAAQPVAVPGPPVPITPLPPTMITPPPVEAVLQSGTLIVISKPSQRMFVFSDGAPWASAPISTGKRRHETPSGVFPILQKHKLHRSNIYSGAPMPFMQRLTWSGIALHAGWVPGYPASHGCVRVPPALAQSLFKLTDASATTVVIGDAPLDTDANAQQFALTARLPVQAALAPPADPLPPGAAVADFVDAQFRIALAIVIPQALLPPSSSPSVSGPPPPMAAPVIRTQSTGAQIVQLTAAASQADAEAYWAHLLKIRPDMSRFEKTVEAAVVNARRVYRLRISGADAHDYCVKLKSEGVGCFNMS